MYHAVQASKGCAVALTTVLVEFTFGEDITTVLGVLGQHGDKRVDVICTSQEKDTIVPWADDQATCDQDLGVTGANCVR